MNREDAKVVLAFMEDNTKNDEKKDALLMAIDALSVDGELISRADAIEAICMNDCGGCRPNECGAYLDKSCDVVKVLSALPSAEADNDDLIIKGAKGIQDGLYNIKDGKLFKYKAKGGTVRTYPIVSAEAVQGEWIVTEHCTNAYGFRKWIEIECPFCGERPTYENLDNMNFCPNCGARMKGADNEID